ncbi:MAG: hypothetical protein ABI675_01870 [Chitinophagaceae bacterium]
MRKILLSFFIVSFSLSLSFAQDGPRQFSKSYYRSDPFIGEFSDFLNHLLNDPLLREKEIQKRTDASLFYFSGVYMDYNPFFFKPKKIELLLQETSVRYTDSLPHDTIFIYQLLAYADSNEKGQQEVKKEFEKIHRVFNKRFYKSNYQDLKTGETITGGLHNYFVSYSGLAPVSIAWGKLENDFVLNISLRIKYSANRAILPASFYNP